MENKTVLNIVIILIVFCICIIALGITYIYTLNKNNINSTTKNNSNIAEEASNDTEVTLKQIAKKFENCKTIKSIIGAGTNLSVKVTSDVLTISSNGTNYDYKLENGILSIKIPKTDVAGGVYLLALVDSIAQLHGYEDGATFSTLNSEVSKNLKISDGFEMIEENNIVKAKIDINKKIKTINDSNIYIEVSDLKDGENFIKNDGSYQTSKGNIYFYKKGYDNECIITIGEKTKLTQNAYKSILNTIELIYDKSEAENFSNKLPILVNKSFDKYKIEINPTLNNMEKIIFGDANCEIVRLTINK